MQTSVLSTSQRIRKGSLFLKCLAGAIALAGASAASATVFPIDSNSDGNSYDGPGDNFYITVGTPTAPYISAIFSNAFATPTSFDDSFTFTIPQNGLGGGSISVSIPTSVPLITLTDVIINGNSYAAELAANNGLTLSVFNVPINAFALNTIRVIGSGQGSYSGTVSFQATAVPEPAAWAMMLCGFGLVGFAMRRRRTNVRYA